MVWFKSDDAFWRHRKVRKLGKDKLPAVGLWELSGTWCADNTTDGFIPNEQIKEFGDLRLRYARKLVEVGLWSETKHEGEDGFQFHCWDEYQPTAASIEAERVKWQQKKAAQRKGGTGSGRKPDGDQVSPGDTSGDNGETPQGTDEETNEGSPLNVPDPIPVPVPVPSKGDLGRGSHLPARASAPPHPRCPKHATAPAGGPCRACADARQARTEFDTAQAEQAETTRLAAARCRLCDGDGRRWDPVSKARGTVGPCDHQPLPRQESA